MEKKLIKYSLKIFRNEIKRELKFEDSLYFKEKLEKEDLELIKRSFLLDYYFKNIWDFKDVLEDIFYKSKDLKDRLEKLYLDLVYDDKFEVVIKRKKDDFFCDFLKIEE